MNEILSACPQFRRASTANSIRRFQEKEFPTFKEFTDVCCTYTCILLLHVFKQNTGMQEHWILNSFKSVHARTHKNASIILKASSSAEKLWCSMNVYKKHSLLTSSNLWMLIAGYLGYEWAEFDWRNFCLYILCVPNV